jgi:hypothetical protein
MKEFEGEWKQLPWESSGSRQHVMGVASRSGQNFNIFNNDLEKGVNGSIIKRTHEVKWLNGRRQS